MTIEEAKAIRAEREAELKAAKQVLGQFPRLANGLAPDDVKATPEYRQAKERSDKAFRAVQEINSFIVKSRK